MAIEQPEGAIRSVPTGTVSAQAFSADGQTIYTVRNGSVSAYDVATGEIKSTWALGTRLGGVDVSADGRYMVVTELGGVQGGTFSIYRIDLTTGVSTTYNVGGGSTYSTGFGDVAILADGRAMLTGTDQWEPLTFYDFATGQVTRTNQTYYPGVFSESADHSTILVSSIGISSAPLYLFTGAGVFVAGRYGSGFNDGVQAISPDGKLIAQGGLAIYDGSLNLVVNLSDRYSFSVAGLAFSADGTKLYVLDKASDQVFALSTKTWDVVGGFNVGADVAPEPSYYGIPASRTADALHVSADGKYLTVTANTSVQVIDLNKVITETGTSAGNDVLTGDSDVNYLYGFEGDDVLDGKGGADRLYGGSGNDTYYVDNASDAVYETANGGVDTIHLTYSGYYQLPYYVERLELGDGATVGYGNDADNILIANDAGNSLYGMNGDDTLTGGRGNDVLDGGLGNDRMEGGAGDDRYIVESPADVVVERAGEGNDTIVANITFTLPTEVENLTLQQGTRTLDGTGNELGNVLTGNSGDNQLRGLAGDDQLSGGAGNDRLFGGDGNDVLDGGAGDDMLDGGAGIDRASYTGLFRSYASSMSPDGVLTVSGGASEGCDTLTSVEQVTFRDGVFQSDPDAAFAQVLRAYDTILGRAPDPVGLDFYVDLMEDRGVTLSAVANDLSASSEFQAATGGLTNAQFVDYVYRHALGRAPDAGGAAHYTGLLDQGVSRGAFVVDLSESTEHRGLTQAQVAQGFFNTDDTYQSVALLYDGFAGRLPDAGGLTFYAERVKAGTMTLGQVAEDFAGSAEFKSLIAGKSNGEIVDFIYQNTLDRAAEAGGKAFYTGLLDNGATAAGVLLDVALSQEHYNLFSSHIVGGVDVI